MKNSPEELKNKFEELSQEVEQKRQRDGKQWENGNQRTGPQSLTQNVLKEQRKWKGKRRKLLKNYSKESSQK